MSWQLVGNIGAKEVPADVVQTAVDAAVTKAMNAIPAVKDGRDGLGVTAAVIDRNGHLMLTTANGTTQDVGLVVGKDGTPGMDGKDAVGIAGKDGKDGADGFGFDDLDLAFDETHGYLLQFRRGDQVKDFELAVPHHAGLWEGGRTYPKGAMVTVNGGSFVALRKTSARPDDASVQSRDWKLAAKRGRDGKPGKDGKDGADV